MKIQIENFRKFDDEAAFACLLQYFVDDCLKKFVLKINKKCGWADDSDDSLEEILIDGLKRHIDVVISGEYARDDLIDIANFCAMLYNLKS